MSPFGGKLSYPLLHRTLGDRNLGWGKGEGGDGGEEGLPWPMSANRRLFQMGMESQARGWLENLIWSCVLICFLWVYDDFGNVEYVAIGFFCFILIYFEKLEGAVQIAKQFPRS